MAIYILKVACSQKFRILGTCGNITSIGTYFGGLTGTNLNYSIIENSYLTTNANVYYGSTLIEDDTGSESYYRGIYVGRAYNAIASGGRAQTNKTIFQVLTEDSMTSSIWTDNTSTGEPTLVWENI